MREKYFMTDYYMLNKKLDKIMLTMPIILTGIEKFNGTKILSETGNKLPDAITLKNCYDINCMFY